MNGGAVTGPALVLVNTSYFRAWQADVPTFPLDLDRLGALAPAGRSVISLPFGRHRTLVASAEGTARS